MYTSNQDIDWTVIGLSERLPPYGTWQASWLALRSLLQHASQWKPNAVKETELFRGPLPIGIFVTVWTKVVYHKSWKGNHYKGG